jgi:hypothetical protein
LIHQLAAFSLLRSEVESEPLISISTAMEPADPPPPDTLQVTVTVRERPLSVSEKFAGARPGIAWLCASVTETKSFFDMGQSALSS